jgi:hypothetical protein
MVESSRLRLWSTCVVSGAPRVFLELKWSGQGRAKSRKVAFHIHPSCSVTEEAESRSRLAEAQMSRRRAVHL